MPFDMEMDEYHEDIKMRNNMKNILICLTFKLWVDLVEEVFLMIKDNFKE